MLLLSSEAGDCLTSDLESRSAVGDGLLRFRHDLQDRSAQRLQCAPLRLLHCREVPIDLLGRHPANLAAGASRGQRRGDVALTCARYCPDCSSHAPMIASSIASAFPISRSATIIMCLAKRFGTEKVSGND